MVLWMVDKMIRIHLLQPLPVLPLLLRLVILPLDPPRAQFRRLSISVPKEIHNAAGVPSEAVDGMIMCYLLEIAQYADCDDRLCFVERSGVDVYPKRQNAELDMTCHKACFDIGLTDTSM